MPKFISFVSFLPQFFSVHLLKIFLFLKGGNMKMEAFNSRTLNSFVVLYNLIIIKK